jgi:hypothetical protein
MVSQYLVGWWQKNEGRTYLYSGRCSAKRTKQRVESLVRGEQLKNWFDNTPNKDNKTLVFVIVFLLVRSNVSKSGVNKLNNWFDNETVE